MARKPSKALTPEDRYLWQKVVKTVKPKATIQKDLLIADDGKSFLEEFSKTPFPTQKPMNLLKDTAQSVVMPTKSLSGVSGASEKSGQPRMQMLDRRSSSKIARGHTLIDGRLDLHGMTQQQAHQALQIFIARAYASRWKTVLVITGKGAQSLENDQDRFIDFGHSQPGVLRRVVPQWLAQGDLARFVVGYGRAAPLHGGNGALYVRIRRNKNAR